MSATTSTGTDPASTEADAAGKGGRKKLLVVLLLVLALGGGAYWFVLKPAPAESVEPEPGEVLVLEAVQVNLAAGHYLRVGLALQLVAGGGGGHGEVDGSKALDATIELFTGLKVAELADTETRNGLRAELLETLDHSYHGEVMDIYFTEFVTQ